ncbi:MAG: TIGR01906 family membrane protein [Ruminococcaceae bacterium]|nr:TIGR01906 family membrane protein [Oscillospiraceae bacterium]
MKKLFYNLILPFTFVALLMFSVIGVSQFRPFFSRQYDKLDTAEYIGIAKDDLMAVTDGLLSYMAGGRENLDMQYEVKGVQREIFDQREKLHMIDVKNLYLGVIYIASALGAAVAAMTAFVLKKDGAKAAMATLNRKYKYVAVGLVLVVAALGIMIITNFQKFWIGFHKVFFTNDLWLLDPAVSIMINMFPLEFFYAICMAVIAVFIVLCGIVKTVLAVYGKK